MSVGHIQDNLVKTSLVQHTQSKGDDVQRGQQIGQVSTQKEEDRQADQVVLHARQKDEAGIRPDDEQEKEGRKKRRKEEEEEENSQKPGQQDTETEDDDTGPRACMRTINIVI